MRIRLRGGLVFAAVVALLNAGMASASIQYFGNFQNGGGGGTRWSFIHSATSGGVTPSGGFHQHTGGRIQFSMDESESVRFLYTDNGASGLDAGDQLQLQIDVGIRDYVTNAIVADLVMVGSLLVTPAAKQSPLFDFGLRSVGGIEYSVKLTDDSTNFDKDDLFTGLAFFQDYHYGGLLSPFNGIKMDGSKLTFAIWGDSRGPDGMTGQKNDHLSRHTQLGFDIYVEGSPIDAEPESPPVPEPASLLIWGCLMGIGVCRAVRRRRPQGCDA